MSGEQGEEVSEGGAIRVARLPNDISMKTAMRFRTTRPLDWLSGRGYASRFSACVRLD